MNFDSAFEARLNADLFGVRIGVQTTAGLESVTEDTGTGVVDPSFSTENHLSFSFGVCLVIPSFASLRLDALSVRTSTLSASLDGASFASQSMQVAAKVLLIFSPPLFFLLLFCLLLAHYYCQVQASSVSEVSTVFLSKLACKALSKIRSAATSTCSFLSSLVKDIMKLPLKTPNGLASCTCPSGKVYSGAGVCVPVPKARKRELCKVFCL